MLQNASAMQSMSVDHLMAGNGPHPMIQARLAEMHSIQAAQLVGTVAQQVVACQTELHKSDSMTFGSH